MSSAKRKRDDGTDSARLTSTPLADLDRTPVILDEDEDDIVQISPPAESSTTRGKRRRVATPEREHSYPPITSIQSSSSLDGRRRQPNITPSSSFATLPPATQPLDDTPNTQPNTPSPSPIAFLGEPSSAPAKTSVVNASLNKPLTTRASPPQETSLSSYTCPICFSPPTNATITPCGHLSCGSCLFTAVKSTLRRGALAGGGEEANVARCPVCRAVIEGWDGRGGGVVGIKVRAVFAL